ncbi:hypothetical protein [Salipiger thiooxidans]|uniref:hypothetical protein n=1 Tax=Salipiger thiooxidans TaxID=282683 RepID=UPI001CD632AE|nr:hypothetical protein [Salipiger thiooxidans]MCA0847245.1 hypothetical protein [Salipiger thiooxidans]
MTVQACKLFDVAEAALLLTEVVHATLGSDASHELLRIGALPNACGLTLPAIGAIPDPLKAE